MKQIVAAASDRANTVYKIKGMHTPNDPSIGTVNPWVIPSFPMVWGVI